MVIERRLTIKQVSEIKNIPISTLKLLCRDGRIPGAKLENTPFGSDFWTIPESSLEHIHLRERGRPPSQKGVKK